MVGIPVQQLPSLVVAHGILDSVATLHSKQLPELLANAKRMGVPLEHKPDHEERERESSGGAIAVSGDICSVCCIRHYVQVISSYMSTHICDDKIVHQRRNE